MRQDGVSPSKSASVLQLILPGSPGKVLAVQTTDISVRNQSSENPESEGDEE